MMRWTARVLGFVLWLSELPAQDRIVAPCDGYPSERLDGDGHFEFLHEFGDFVEGVGALRISPIAESRFYGVVFKNLSGSSPKGLKLSVLIQGEEPAELLIRLQASSRNEDQVDLTRTVEPGSFREIEIDLGSLRSKGASDPVDFKNGVSYLRVSRRKKDDHSSPFRVDAVALTGESPDEVSTTLLSRFLGERCEWEAQDLSKARRALQTSVPSPSLAKSILGALQRETNETSRRQLREALPKATDPESVEFVRTSAQRLRGETRLEVLWILAGMRSANARKTAMEWAGDSKFTPEERATLLSGLGLRGSNDLLPITEKIGPKDPWQVHSALVASLQVSGTTEAIDALIAILAKRVHSRSTSDAEEALRALTGNDLGGDAKAWRDWFDQNRNSPRLGSTAQNASKTYARFFGIPINSGRIVFVLDISGSMREKLGPGKVQDHLQNSEHLRGQKIESRLDLAKAELSATLAKLPREAHFGVIAFNDDALWLTKGLERNLEENRKSALQRIAGLSAGQKTNIHDGLFFAFHPEKKRKPEDLEQGPDTICLLSDGHPSAGLLKDFDELRDAVLRWNLGRSIRIHVVSVGTSELEIFRTWTGSTGGTLVDLSSSTTKQRAGGQ